MVKKIQWLIALLVFKFLGREPATLKSGKRNGYRNFNEDELELIFIEVLEGSGTLKERAAKMARRLGNRSYTNMLSRMRKIEEDIKKDTLATGGHVLEHQPATNGSVRQTKQIDCRSWEDLLLQKLRETFDRNGDIFGSTDSHGNVWVMCVTAIPYHASKTSFLPVSLQAPSQCTFRTLNDRNPTHFARVLLRTTDPRNGTSPFVDGSDFCFHIDEEGQIAEFVWEETCFEDGPKFHGGDVPSALTWATEMSVPLYVQFHDPFLTPEQNEEINGHRDEATPPLTEQQSEDDKLKDDDIENWI
ncbi:hypothetical protein PV433_11930 [Paenibacillus sp. GYB004]|uniref:hypothetical protein n=1 Tax=Paenibacillus sp. GYB004 TaxID=2994393 RepID=UPI002F969A99